MSIATPKPWLVLHHACPPNASLGQIPGLLSPCFDPLYTRAAIPQQLFFSGVVRGESAMRFEEDVGSEVKYEVTVSILVCGFSMVPHPTEERLRHVPWAQFPGRRGKGRTLLCSSASSRPLSCMWTWAIGRYWGHSQRFPGYFLVGWESLGESLLGTSARAWACGAGLRLLSGTLPLLGWCLLIHMAPQWFY